MKTRMMVLTGMMLSFTAFAWQADPMVEERHKMKYGRYTPAEEARQKALAEARGKSAEGVEVAACCRKMHAVFKNSSGETLAEERFRVKFGRRTPAVEAREAKEAELTATHVNQCIELKECTSMHAAVLSRPAAKESLTEAWLRGKFGRGTANDTEPVALASTTNTDCEHQCCKQAE